MENVITLINPPREGDPPYIHAAWNAAVFDRDTNDYYCLVSFDWNTSNYEVTVYNKYSSVSVFICRVPRRVADAFKTNLRS